jgi:hypothetical protein
MTTRDLAALVADWAANGHHAAEMKTLIRTWCEEAAADGIPTGRQLALLAAVGITFGAGGAGGLGSGDLTCGYCGASGNGGHGGWCPNWVPTGIGDPATWVGAVPVLPVQECP